MKKRYVIDPYGFAVVFVTTAKEWDQVSDSSLIPARGCVSKSPMDGTYVCGVFDRSLSTMVHECVHLACWILKDAKINPMSSNQESLCYLVEQLVELGRSVVRT